MSKQIKVYTEPCENCLFTEQRIVSAKRAKEVINTCIEDQTHFTCHKASMKDEDVCCKTFFDKMSDKIVKLRIARSFPDQLIDWIVMPKDNIKLISYIEKRNEYRKRNTTS